MPTSQPDIDTALDWRGRTVVDRDGEKIGRFEELYLDNDDRPAWAAVNTGLFGLRHSFVPLLGAERADDDIRVPFAKDRVKDAPNVDPDEQLSPEEEDRLFDHYGIAERDEPDAGGARGDAVDRGETAGRGGEVDRGETAGRGGEVERGEDVDRGETVERGETAGRGETVERGEAAERRDDDEAAQGTDTAMTRSEEELVVGTRRRVRGKARLRKYVVTEHVQRTIPVQREEVRVEYEPTEGEGGPREVEGEGDRTDRAPDARPRDPDTR